jgi:hypothetical protein
MEDHKRRMNRWISLPMFADLEEEVIYKDRIKEKGEE